LVATEDAGLQLMRRGFHLLRELAYLFPRRRYVITGRQLLEHPRSKTLLKLADTPKDSGMVHAENQGSRPD
jgi:hypothetical protein